MVLVLLPHPDRDHQQLQPRLLADIPLPAARHAQVHGHQLRSGGRQSYQAGGGQV